MLIVASGAMLGRLDVGDLADGDAAIGHVGRRVQPARCRQLGLQRVPADTHQARDPQVVDTQHEQRDDGQDPEQRSAGV